MIRHVAAGTHAGQQNRLDTQVCGHESVFEQVYRRYIGYTVYPKL